MPDHQQRITYLLERYVNGSCSREELDELFAAIGKGEMPETVDRFLEESWHADVTAPDIDYEQVYRQIRPSAPYRKSILSYKRLAAAAAILLLAVIGYRTANRQQVSEPAASRVQASEVGIAPGSNKAMLTLEDGSVVTLDSSGQQVIRQGKIAIRQHNGQLQYTSQPADGTIHYNKLTTPRGGQFRVVLPDGSKVWLNSASMLRYPTAFNGKERIVELEGQGYFEFAPNAQQPFKVKVHDMEVQVLGTDFDIMAYADETSINTTLLTGSIQVKEGNTAQLLCPGQQAQMNNKGHQLTVRTADIRKVTAWKNGLFVFNNMDLPAILREVARWHDVDIVYAASPGTELYGGGISRNLQLADILALLEGNGYNHFKVEGRRVIVLP